MTLVKIPGESPATFAARVRRTEIAVGNPDPGPSIAELLASVRAGTQSRSLNPCGQVAGGLFGPGNTCAAGDGSGGTPAPTPETPAPFQPGGPQLTGYKPPEVPPELVGAGKSWAEVRKENIKDFNRMRKRIVALQGAAKEKYLAAVELKHNAQEAMEKWQEEFDRAHAAEKAADAAAFALRPDSPQTSEEREAIIKAASDAARERMRIGGLADDIQRDMDNALLNYEKVKEANRDIANKVLREEIGRVLREDGGKGLEIAADMSREKLELSRTDHKRLTGDASRMIGNSGDAIAAESVAIFQSSPTAAKNLEESDKFLRGVAHPLIHRRALGGPVQYENTRDRAAAGYGIDAEYFSKLVAAELPRGQALSPERLALWNRWAQSVGTVYLSGKESASVVAHEFGHQIEHANHEARDLAWDFSVERTKGSPEVKLKEKYPDSIYTDDEIGRSDDFAKSFAAVRLSDQWAAEHSALYVGKRYEGTRATEIVSMGVELMKTDGAAFAIADPEYFDLIAGILTGRALTQTRKAFNKARQGTPITTGS